MSCSTIEPRRQCPSDFLGTKVHHLTHPTKQNPFTSLAKRECLAIIRKRASFVGMKLLFILYALSVAIMLAVFICIFISEKKRNTKPWYRVAALILFAPVTLVGAIVVAIREDYKYRHSPQQEERRLYLQEQERKEQERKASLALYLQRYSAQRMAVPEACLEVAYSLLRAVKERKYTTLLAHLDHLHLPEGKNLFVQFPSHHGCGDRSRLYVADSMYGQEMGHFFLYYDDNRKPAPYDERSYNILHHLRVDDTLMGAWQALLVSQLWHVLPIWWHGAYDERRYIFTMEHLRQLVALPRKDRSALHLQPSDYTVTPEYVEAGKGCYYFTWCYWTEWDGLIRETLQVTICDSVASVLHLDEETLHRYDCGWML